MRSIIFISLFTFLSLGCEPTQALSGAEEELTGETKPLVDPGYDAARIAVDSIRDEDGDRKPRKIDHRMEREFRDLFDQGCDLVAFMVIRWADASNSYRGSVFNLDGTAVAKVRGEYAPVTHQLGAFAGKYKVPRPIGLPGDPVEPVEVTAEARDTDLVATTDETDLDDVLNHEGEIIECPIDGGDCIRPVGPIQGPMGGGYTIDHRLVGAFTRGNTLLPMQGIWDRTDSQGGYALGLISSCS